MSERIVRTSGETRDAFLAWASDNGFTLAEPFEWKNTRTRYPATCSDGHSCGLLPYSVLNNGQSGCRTCGRKTAHKPGTPRKDGAMKRTDVSRLAFLAWASDNGFALAEPFEWRGVAKTYPATCRNGHACAVRPNSVQQGQSGCAPCSRVGRGLKRRDSAAARDLFLAWASDNGFTLTEPFEWRGTLDTYSATCPQGHKCRPCPGHVRTGVGGCGACKGKVWDAFYVVWNKDAGAVKFGVTSGDPRPRLGDHARNGFTDVLRTYTGLPEGEAASLERELMNLLRIAGVPPVHGREYFPDTVMNMLLSTVDAYRLT